MEIYYMNNSGHVVNFMEWPYMISESDLFDYEWKYESKSTSDSKISRFYRALVEKSVKISISSPSKSLYDRALMHLLDVIDADIRNLTPGRLYVGEEYLPCYFFKSEKSDWVPGVAFLVNTFSIVSEKGSWIKETTEVFRSDISVYENGSNLDYPYDHPYDFSSGATDGRIQNDGITAVDFVITIYGSCLNPSVNIGGHTYKVNADLDTGEYMIINSVSKKVYKVKTNGNIVNLFNQRERDSYIFEKIPPGINAVTWSGLYGFDITLHEERSEPTWT